MEENKISQNPMDVADQNIEAEEQRLIKEAEEMQRQKDQARPKINLNDEQTLAMLEEAVKDFELNRLIPEAREFSNRLEKRLSSELALPADFRQKYEQLLLRAEFLSFSILPEEKQIELLKTSLLKYLALQVENPVSMKEEIRLAMVSHIDALELLPFQEKLIKALEDNSEKLGNLKLAMKGTGEVSDYTLKNWLDDYKRSQIGAADEKTGALERISYLNKNANAIHLSKPDKDLLLSVLLIYDKLRFDPLTPVAGEASEEVLKATREYLRTLIPEVAPFIAPSIPIAISKNLPPPPKPSKISQGNLGGQATQTPRSIPLQPKPVPPAPPSQLYADRHTVGTMPETIPSHSPVPQGRGNTALSNEDLYKQTLEELNKMREFERPAQVKVQPKPAALWPEPAKPNTQEQKIVDEQLAWKNQPSVIGPEPFSVNDALARAGLAAKENEKAGELVTGGGSGSVGPKTQPAKHEDDVDRELADLEDRIGKGQD